MHVPSADDDQQAGLDDRPPLDSVVLHTMVATMRGNGRDEEAGVSIVFRWQ